MSDDTATADLGEGYDRVWDETTRPTLDEAADASYPPAQEAVAQHLVDVHHHLREELIRLRRLVDEVRRGLLSTSGARAEVNAMSLRQNNWALGAYCQAYCSFVNGHHSLEDAGVFPHLRRSEPAVALVVDRLQEEHVVIHEILERVDRALVTLVRDGGTDALDGLERTVDLLSDSLLSHLSYEERELRGPLARHGFY